MQRVRISPQTFPYPMPMAIVSTVVDGAVNHMAVGWITRTNFKPPMIGIALGKSHHSNRGIRANGEFGVSVPSADMLGAVDHVGLVSGATTDKAGIFEVFFGSLERAPLVASCPLAMACRLAHTMDLPTNELFIGEIVEAYCGADFLTAGIPDIEKMKPFTLTMPDNRYWGVGEMLGKAWEIGETFQASAASRTL